MSILRVCLLAVAVICSGVASAAAADDPWVVYEGQEGPGKGKHIVLISGDEEYRSEEALPQLGRILARHHGFKCTVLFAINPESGEIDPNYTKNIPGLEALKSADLMIMFLRFRDLPDEQMQHIVDYVNSGRPIIGLRTATHAFNIGREDASFKSWSFRSQEWDGGFGRQVLGETWISHHGQHGRQSTRGIIAPGKKEHPILTGLNDGDVWGPTDVYGVRLPLPGDSEPLLLGQVLSGMQPDDPPAEGKQNDPMMPIAWVKTYTGESGQTSKVFTTTMGSSQDLENVGFRRLLVNAVYWTLGMEDQIRADSSVEIVGDFEASPFKFGGFRKGVKPADLRLDE